MSHFKKIIHLNGHNSLNYAARNLRFVNIQKCLTCSLYYAFHTYTTKTSGGGREGGNFNQTYTWYNCHRTGMIES